MIKNISQYKDDSMAHTHSIVTNPDDKNFYFHTHDICEFIYIKSGDTSAIIGDRTYKLQKDSLVIFRSNIPHRMRIDGNEVYERHNILFDETKLANGIFQKFPSFFGKNYGLGVEKFFILVYNKAVCVYITTNHKKINYF